MGIVTKFYGASRLIRKKTGIKMNVYICVCTGIYICVHKDHYID